MRTKATVRLTEMSPLAAFLMQAAHDTHLIELRRGLDRRWLWVTGYVLDANGGGVDVTLTDVEVSSGEGARHAPGGRSTTTTPPAPQTAPGRDDVSRKRANGDE